MEAKEKWSRLDPKDRQRLLDKFRDIDVLDDWWDSVYDTFKASMTEIGVHVENIYFSGFSHQGDGACFEGAINDWPKFLKAVGRQDLADIYVTDLEGCTAASLTWRHSGHYYHEHCVTFNADLVVDNPHDEDEQPLRQAAWEIVHGSDGPLAPLEDDFIEFIKDKMRGLYDQLEEEFDFLTDDENITEYILDCREDEIDHLLMTEDHQEYEMA